MASDQAQLDDGMIAPPTGLSAPVKLVIWDLDETLWTGTLSEGPVRLAPARAELVRELNRRGIMNSICSKNDHAAARDRLIAENLWEEFVFPSVSWSPKGQQIARIIADMQLRPENVLFIDDNVGNIEEARFYVTGIQTAGPEIAASMLSLQQLKGKDDRRLSRLQQYQLLERKVADRASTASSNEDFLRSCDICVHLGEDCVAETDRLVELMNRTNQLNYTKRRVTESEFRVMLADDMRETRYVHVRDRYGDYGICGLYSLRNGQLTDFVFSCRILHMGVEQWLYRELGCPPIKVVGEVSTALQPDNSVDWIRQIAVNAHEPPITSGDVAERSPSHSSHVLLKGGCDLWVVHDFLHGSLIDEFTYPSATGADVRGDHTEILRRSTQDVLHDFGSLIDRLPFLDRPAYSSQLVRSPEAFGTIIYSVLMDYTQGLYRFEDTKFVVPYGQHDEDITDPTHWPYLESQWAAVGVDRPFLAWFSEHFSYEGGLSPAAFQDNLRWLRASLPMSSRLILINGAEVVLDHDRELDRHLHHRRMNQALDEMVHALPNTVLCDVRHLVTSADDVANNIRHYHRRAYMEIAKRLTELVEDDIDVETRAPIVQMRKFQRRVRRKIGRMMKDGQRR
jgi:FkbH-like protein